MYQLFKLLTLSSILFSAQNLYADSELSAEVESSNEISHTLSAGLTSGVSTIPEEKTQQIFSYDYIAGFRASKNISLSLTLGGYSEISGLERESHLNNSYIGANFLNLYQNEFGKFYINTLTTIPTNEDARDISSLRGAFQAGPNFVFKTSSNFYVKVRSNLSRSFHEYKQGRNSGYNRKYTLSHRMDFMYQLNDTFTFSNIFSNSHTWAYEGFRRPDVFSMRQKVDVNITPSSAISFGHAISDYTFADNGNTSNLQLFDSKSSTVYASFTTSF